MPRATKMPAYQQSNHKVLSLTIRHRLSGSAQFDDPGRNTKLRLALLSLSSVIPVMVCWLDGSVTCLSVREIFCVGSLFECRSRCCNNQSDFVNQSYGSTCFCGTSMSHSRVDPLSLSLIGIAWVSTARKLAVLTNLPIIEQCCAYGVTAIQTSIMSAHTLSEDFLLPMAFEFLEHRMSKSLFMGQSYPDIDGSQRNPPLRL